MQRFAFDRLFPIHIRPNWPSNHANLSSSQNHRLTILFRAIQILATLVGAAILLFLYKVLFNTDIGPESSFSGVALLICIGVELFLFLALYWVTKGHANWAVILVSLCLLASIGYGSIYMGTGFYDPAVHIIYLILLLVSIFQSRTLPLIIASASCVLVIILYVCTQRGMIHVPTEIPEVEDLVMVLIGLVGTYFLIRVTINQLIGATEQLSEQSAQLQQKSDELLLYQNQLEGLVEKRTVQLIKERDKAESANRAKSEFLARMSHELRTPLNAIIGYSELIVEEIEPGSTIPGEILEPDLGRIGYSARHLLELINDVLDLSRIEAENLDLHIKPVDLNKLIDNVSGAVRPIIERQDNWFEIDIDLDSSQIETDEGRLIQILLNLLGNAAKFTSGGGVTLRVYEVPADSEVCFDIIDSGIGIDPNFLANIFNPFSQEENSYSRSQDGSGLGLAISKHLCHVLGGRIDVESQKGKGSSFKVTLPHSFKPNSDATT